MHLFLSYSKLCLRSYSVNGPTAQRSGNAYRKRSYNEVVRFDTQRSNLESIKSRNSIIILLFTTAFVLALPTSSAPPRA